MSTKLIFFDIDGTIVDMQTKSMTCRMEKTLKTLKDEGIIICIATGRSPVQLTQFSKIEFDAYLTFNGSYCFTSSGKKILSDTIPKKMSSRSSKTPPRSVDHYRSPLTRSPYLMVKTMILSPIMPSQMEGPTSVMGLMTSLKTMTSTK